MKAKGIFNGAVRFACALGLLIGAPQQALASKSRETIEVRLVAKTGGTPFAFADGQTVLLERRALLRTVDFSRVIVRPGRNPNLPGKVEVEAIYAEKARTLFVETGERDRTRTYCVLIGGVVDNCPAFPPPQKDIYDRGQTLMERLPAKARRLAAGLNATIANIKSDQIKAEAAAKSGPLSLLTLLYRRAVNERSPQWLDAEERDTFLSRDLVELWLKVDAAQDGGNENEIFSADPVAATNAFTLKSFNISLVERAANHARASVTVSYAEAAPHQVIAYDLVREHGFWRIANIGEGQSSLRSALEAFIAQPPLSPDAR